MKANWRTVLVGVATAVLGFPSILPATAFSTPTEDVPCDSPDAAELFEPPIQVGYRFERRHETTGYVYTVVNRSNDTLTAVQVGWDAKQKMCELTGARPHVPPDTAYSPPGWQCVPLQDKDPTVFALGWQLADASLNRGGIPPNASLSGFTVALQQPDSIYEHCHWLIRFTTFPKQAYVGQLLPENELDPITSETGTLTGRVTDEHGAGIAGVNVSVARSTMGTLTGPGGTYRLSQVPAGRLTVMARRVGFDPCDHAHVRIIPPATTRLDFRLTPSTTPSPCVPYETAIGSLEQPFPGDAVDTLGAQFLDPSVPIPPRSPGDRSEPRAFISSLSGSRVSLTYRGLGSDTVPSAFVASVTRSFRTSEEERLIRIAEETFPPAEAVLAAASSGPASVALAKEGRLWWYGEFDGIRLPYAVTMDAVRYYLGLTQALGRGDTTQTNRIRMKRCEFSYHASVSAKPMTYSRDGRVFKDVYVVQMGLKWFNYCGMECACGFHLDRTVVLRRDGTVLGVFGDQKPSVVVS